MNISKVSVHAILHFVEWNFESSVGDSDALRIFSNPSSTFYSRMLDALFHTAYAFASDGAASAITPSTPSLVTDPTAVGVDGNVTGLSASPSFASTSSTSSSPTLVAFPSEFVTQNPSQEVCFSRNHFSF
jgi:hypothetical protein